MKNEIISGKKQLYSAISKILAACNYIVISFNLVFSIIGLFPGLEYNLRNKTIWLALSSALLAAAVIASRLIPENSNRYLLIHLISYPAVFILFIGGTDLGFPAYLLMIAVLVLSGILFKRSFHPKKTKNCVQAITVLFAIPTLVMFCFCLFFDLSGGAAVITNRHFSSPGGLYEAELRIVDQGALGGDTMITVYKTGAHILLPFGTLSRPLNQYRTGWISPDELDVHWEDEPVIIINHRTWHWQKP